jgi:hypothetical protein
MYGSKMFTRKKEDILKISQIVIFCVPADKKMADQTDSPTSHSLLVSPSTPLQQSRMKFCL